MTTRKALVAGLALASLSVASAVGAPDLELIFDRLNGTYENLTADVEPIQSGPITIRLSSPEHRLEMHSNRIRLSPGASGDTHEMRGEVRFAGAGQLVASLDFGGFPASLQDRVEFPDQLVVVEGEVRIERLPEGYKVTAERLPRFIEIDVRSQLGSSLVAWCGKLALFIAGGEACEQLERQISRPRLPLPRAGESVLVRQEDLTPKERSSLDDYLAAVATR